MHLVVADDEKAVQDSLARTLRSAGYTVSVAGDGVAGLRLIRSEAPDAVLLASSMPRLDGLRATRMLRAEGNTVPLLMLTARSAVTDRVAGLDAGADGYLIKPFALPELLARVRALLRRTRYASSTAAAPPSRLQFADVVMDTGTREVYCGDHQLKLTKTEFEMLKTFLRNPRTVLTRTVLFENVWGYDFGSSSNGLDVYIGYLRRKLESGGAPRLLHTVRGVGYVLREEPL